MAVDIRIAGKSDAKYWDRIVDESPHGTLFHKWQWLKIMEKYSGAKFCPLIGMKGEEIVGLYPLFVKKKLKMNFVFSPPPHLSVLYLGPIIRNYEKMKQSKKETAFMDFQMGTDDYIKSEFKPHYILILTSPGLLDSRPLRWAGYEVEPKYNYLLDISGGKEAVWNGMEKKVRYTINKSIREGVKIETGGINELKLICKAMVDRYREQGKVVKVPLEYLIELHGCFGDNIRVIIAKYMDEFVTGFIDIVYKKRISSWIGNPKTKLVGINPNDLLNWESMKWGCENGLRYHETVGAAGVERLSKYYSKFNPDLSLCYRATKYPSRISRAIEFSYMRVMKPISERFESGGG